MTTMVILPALGGSEEAGRVTNWRKAPGEQVIQGEPLVEVETETAVLEIASPVAGVLASIIAFPGEDIPVGQVIATILAEDAASSLLDADHEQVLPPHTSQHTTSVRTSQHTASERTASESASDVLHSHLIREVNADRLLSWQQHLLKRDGLECSYVDLLIKVVAVTLRSVPDLNAIWHEGKLSVQKNVHIGIAIATEQGMIVPVIHHVDRLSLQEIAQRRRELAEKVRTRKVQAGDLRNATFVISDLGLYQRDALNTMLQSPHVATLAMGRIVDRAVLVRQQPTVQPMLQLTLAYDQRISDPSLPAQFLTLLADLIEEPLGLLS